MAKETKETFSGKTKDLTFEAFEEKDSFPASLAVLKQPLISKEAVDFVF